MTVHKTLPESELHEPLGIQPLTGGASDVGKVIVSKGDGTSEARKLIATDLGFNVPSIGFFDYNDNATTGTPIAVTASTPTVLTNDELGSFTNKDYPPSDDITDVYDASTNSFDLSQLSLGDMIDIRLDIAVTTTAANQQVDVYLELAQGTGTTYTIPFITGAQFKTAGMYTLNRFNGIYIGAADTLNNPAQFKIVTDASATVTVNGWYCKVIHVDRP